MILPLGRWAVACVGVGVLFTVCTSSGTRTAQDSSGRRAPTSAELAVPASQRVEVEARTALG